MFKELFEKTLDESKIKGYDDFFKKVSNLSDGEYKISKFPPEWIEIKQNIKYGWTQVDFLTTNPFGKNNYLYGYFKENEIVEMWMGLGDKIEKSKRKEMMEFLIQKVKLIKEK